MITKFISYCYLPGNQYNTQRYDAYRKFGNPTLFWYGDLMHGSCMMITCQHVIICETYDSMERLNVINGFIFNSNTVQCYQCCWCYYNIITDHCKYIKLQSGLYIGYIITCTVLMHGCRCTIIMYVYYHFLLLH